MAHAALLALLRVAVDKVTSQILEEFWLLWGLDKDIQKLSSTLSTILAVLEGAEEQQLKEKEVKNWLVKLTDASYEADDILDKCATEASRRKLETQGRVTKKVRDFFSASNPVVFDLRMARKIKEISERLDAIAGERSKFHLRQGERTTKITGRDESDSHVIESVVKGREEDQERMVELLFNVGNEEKVSIISITGMGGLGKTTLAQLVYNDERVKGHFYPRIWVCVSDDYDMVRLTKKIIESSTHSKCNLDNMELLQDHLRENLSGQKFLLVLDDVWNKKPFDWERLKSFMQAGEVGSKILVTTRSEEDASIMGTHHLYPLRRLSDAVCWSLFHQRAFGRGQEEDPRLVDIGMEIVKKCGGVPLAAKALGSLMRSKGGESEWKSVKESEIWNLPEKHDSIFPALRLSYNDLPSHLKPCFTYCSIFPKDHSFKIEDLIQLWMAEGFILPCQGNRLMEDIGREYFNNLLWRSFFQDAEKDDDGNVVRCKMHDLVHDLAQSVSEDARSILISEDGKITAPNGCRRLFVVGRSLGQNSTALIPSNRAKKLRTLLVGTSRIGMLSHEISTYLPCLRVLDLSDMYVTKNMLNSICLLRQLRYLRLGIRVFGMRILPNSFSKLQNLQTLRLEYFHNLKELPRDMRKMTSLRHLEIPSWESLTHMPDKMGELLFLQTLPVFIVGKDNRSNIRELQGLSHLKGELSIRNLENVTDGRNAREAKISAKARLRTLNFSWKHDFIIDADLRNRREQTLEGLQPHPNLRCLKVESYAGARLPHWMSCSFLPNLVQLWLTYCTQCKELPSLGELPRLKFLHMHRMDALECIGSDFYGENGFPSVEELTLECMLNLEEWSGGGANCRQAFPRLTKLSVSGCPKLAVVPCFPPLSLLEEVCFEDMGNLKQWTGCDGRQVLLPRLKNLTVTGCPKLIEMPFFRPDPSLKTQKSPKLSSSARLDWESFFDSIPGGNLLLL